MQDGESELRTPPGSGDSQQTTASVRDGLEKSSRQPRELTDKLVSLNHIVL